MAVINFITAPSLVSFQGEMKEEEGPTETTKKRKKKKRETWGRWVRVSKAHNLRKEILRKNTTFWALDEKLKE